MEFVYKMFQIRSGRVLAVVAGILLTASSVIADMNDLDGPIIEPNKSELILQNGENFTLTCKSKNKIKFKQQEQAENITRPFEIFERITSDDEYDYIIHLDLINVNEHAVGYFACFNDYINGDGVLKLNSIKAELSNTENITYIYIYVNGSENLFAPMNQILTVKDGSNVVIGCRPTSPDIIVDLVDDITIEKYDPKIGFTVHSDNFISTKTDIVECNCRTKTYPYKKEMRDVFIHKFIGYQQGPTIMENPTHFMEGDTFTLSCYVKYENNIAVHLNWTYPAEKERVIIYTNQNEHIIEGKYYKNITVFDAKESDAGSYICQLNNENETKVNKVFTSQAFINFKSDNINRTIEERKNTLKIVFKLESYPPANIKLYKDDFARIEFVDKFVWNKKTKVYYDFMINSITLDDTGNYTFVAYNDYLTQNLTFDIRVMTPPIVSLDPSEITYVVDSLKDNWIVCNVSGYPLPTVTWTTTFFSYGSNFTETLTSHQQTNSLIQLSSYLDLSQLNFSGIVTCGAIYNDVPVSSSKRIILYEIEGGFGIKDKNNVWFVEGDNVTLTCVGSLEVYDNVTWVTLDDMELKGEFSENYISNVATLKLRGIITSQSGQYVCKGYGKDGSEHSDYINISVNGIVSPVFIEPTKEFEDNVYPHQNVSLVCKASGIPRPVIEWFKDDELVNFDSNGTLLLSQKEIDHTNIESKLSIVNVQEEFGGIYECIANNNVRSKRFIVNVITARASGFNVYIYFAIIPVIIVLLFVILYLLCKVRKEKKYRKELKKAGLLHFKRGLTKSLNPDLGVDEQAELLPYKDRFEFPSSKLLLGKQLGSGAFGVVYKAEAKGIINAEETTTVAAKMVRKTADNVAIKSLTTELKIMCHLGKHVNVVNLLGACTKNIEKRELIVIVEYCRFGNIQNYMKKHRDVFINQLTDNTEKGVGRINRGFSCSSGTSGHSTYCGSNHTQATDDTFLNTVGSNRSGLRKDNGIQQVELGKVSESGYVQPMWCTNYESDYKDEERPMRPLTSRDLLCWAFQIARGMEYLSSRKVLHGDLAARNILLADDNVVKICDFGLARSIYKNDEYQKKENSPLPIKWLAIECMLDRIFSTQSDVWSFGIVLWELFTLAKNPYPDLNPKELLPWLMEGKRLNKPPYADERLYKVMMQCWEKEPNARPSFTVLQETIGSFLEDNERTYYIDLNNTYLNMNEKAADPEDYLMMMRAPDYNQHVTPDPHLYANDCNNIFLKTPTLQHDEEGYLQMNTLKKGTAYEPHTQSTAFDFDARKLTRSQEATTHGSELTPMLTLNNLPRSGSESDYEGNASPGLQICPPIEEESDDVFEVNKNNIKNSDQNRAVTNPTYIAFDADLEKKPQPHNYANIGNGLVI